jgi:hypothetical protein
LVSEFEETGGSKERVNVCVDAKVELEYEVELDLSISHRC